MKNKIEKVSIIIWSILCAGSAIYSYFQRMKDTEDEVLWIMKKLSEGNQLAGIASSIMIMLCGAVTLYLINETKDTTLFCLLAMPIGAVLWIAVSAVLLCIGVHYSLLSVLTVISCWWFLLFVRKRRRDIKSSYDITCILIMSLILVGGVLLASSGIFYANEENDSFQLIELFGRAFANTGYLGPEYLKILTSSSIGSATLAAEAYMFGAGNVATLHQTLTISFFGLFIYSLIKQSVGIASKNTTIIVCLFCLLLLSVPCYALLSSLIVSNCFQMIFMFVVLLIFQRNEERQQFYADDRCLLLLMFFALAFMRAEAPAINCAIVISLISAKLHGKEIVAFCLVPSILGTALNYFKILYLVHGSEGEYWLDQKMILIMMMLYLVVTFYYLFVRGKYLHFIEDHPIASFDIGMMAVALVLFVILKQGFIDACSVYLYNFTYFRLPMEYSWYSIGMWGISASVIAILWLYGRFHYNGKNTVVIIMPIILFLFTVNLGFARAVAIWGPRKGWGDSFNRSFISCVPIVIYGLYIMYLDIEKRSVTH